MELAHAVKYSLGQVVRDAHNEPAVVLAFENDVLTIMQTVGENRGRICERHAYPDGRGGWPVLRVHGEEADQAREVAREEWRRQGLTRAQFGITA